MRILLRAILVITCSLALSNGIAQTHLLKTTITCKAATGNAHTLLHELREYCGVIIEYSPSSLDNEKTITLVNKTTTLADVLNTILKGQHVSIIERNDKIMIVPAITPFTPPIEKYVLNGFIQQEGNLEPLPFATIRDVSTGALCESNQAGFYTLQLTTGEHRLEVSFTGFSVRTILLNIDQHTRFNIALSPALLPDVEVNSGNVLKKDAASTLDRDQSGIYSNMLGETDPARSIYLLPGNVESKEAGGRMIVRGGDPGQSLFLLDGNPIFNPGHLLGEISIVSNTSVQSIKQYKNDFPSRFSGGLSSVTDIHTKDGNMQRWSGEAEAGLLSAAITVEGPVKPERTALMVSVRRTFGSAFEDILNYDAFFGDTHCKLTHRINKNNKLLLSGYIGNDYLKLTQDNNQYLQKWNNSLLTAQWNHVTGRRSFINTAMNLSSFNNLAALQYNGSTNTSGAIHPVVFGNYSTGLRYEAKTDIELTASPHWQFLFGGQFEYVTIQPYSTRVTSVFEEEPDLYKKLHSLSSQNIVVYYENEIRIGNRVLIRPGIHYNIYSYKNYHYHPLQPRFFGALSIDNHQQVSLSYSHISQVLHLIASPYTGINRELWVPANKQLQPAESNMLNLGYQYKNSRLLNVSAAIYYKTTDHLQAFSANSNILYNSDTIANKIITGKGWSYGAELVAEKKLKKWKALLSYTLSWNWRQFDSLNNGNKQPYRYDRRHTLNLVLSYQPDQSIAITAGWYFHTGDWITLPATIPSNPQESMSETGTATFQPFRDQPFNRLNINTTCYLKPTKHFRHQLNAGLHIISKSSRDYTTQLSTGNDQETISLTPNQVPQYSWYVAYNISF